MLRYILKIQYYYLKSQNEPCQLMICFRRNPILLKFFSMQKNESNEEVQFGRKKWLFES